VRAYNAVQDPLAGFQMAASWQGRRGEGRVGKNKGRTERKEKTALAGVSRGLTGQACCVVTLLMCVLTAVSVCQIANLLFKACHGWRCSVVVGVGFDQHS